MIVLDASAWVRPWSMRGPLGDAARTVLTADPQWLTPPHAPLEVLRTLRRYEANGTLPTSSADLLAAEVISAEVLFAPTDPALLNYVWDRRHNLSPYDAPYAALAQRLNVALVTQDRRLARAAEALGVAVIVPGS